MKSNTVERLLTCLNGKIPNEDGKVPYRLCFWNSLVEDVTTEIGGDSNSNLLKNIVFDNRENTLTKVFSSADGDESFVIYDCDKFSTAKLFFRNEKAAIPPIVFTA